MRVRVVGKVVSALKELSEAPRQGDEGAPSAWLEFEPDIAQAARDLTPGDDVLVLTWLDKADREVLTVHPRGDETRALQGVFSTRSPHRPNPIGLHRVKVLAVEGNRVQVSDMEAIDGTPVLDVKPVLGDTR